MPYNDLATIDQHAFKDNVSKQKVIFKHFICNPCLLQFILYSFYLYEFLAFIQSQVTHNTLGSRI